jgi:hypothetical protein
MIALAVAPWYFGLEHPLRLPTRRQPPPEVERKGE